MTGPLHGPWPRPAPAVEAELNRVLNEVIKYNYGRIQISSQITAESPLLEYLKATPEQRERWATSRTEREAVDRPMLDAFLSELAALRAKYPDVRMFEDEYGGIEIVHGAARQWVDTD